jgi:hypothetical protein
VSLRRLVTIPGCLLAAALALPALPLLLALALLTDAVVRKRGVATRLVLFGAVYLACGVAGIVASGVLWLARAWPGFAGERATAAEYALQHWWTRTLFRAAAGIFGLGLRLEADVEPPAAPLLVFIRHASIVDVLLPAVLLSNRWGLRLRYVLKRELLWDPCIDLNAHRLPNYFVWRSAPDSRPEIAAVRGLARDLAPGDGVLIYPEGTRFTPAKREHILKRLEEQGDPLLPRARELQSVLPPKPGGPLGLLDASPDADVLFFGHVGLEGLATLRDVWRGGLVGRTIRVRLWRVQRAHIPSSAGERLEWLYTEWRRMDAFVRSGLGGSRSG